MSSMFNQPPPPYEKLIFPGVKKTNCRPPPPILPPNGCIDKAKIRKYPCGFPGCQWVFTRTNHVVRHHERVHPGFKPTHTTSNSRSNNHLNNSSLINNNTNNSTENLLMNNKKGSPSKPTNVSQDTAIVTATPIPTSGLGFKLREALTGFYLCYVTGCKQRFNTKNELNIHLFQVHSLVEPEVCIKVEGQEWNDEENTTLMTNKLSSPYSPDSPLASSDRRYICDALGCDKSYTKNSHLIRHKEDSHNLLRPPNPLKLLRSPRPYACTLPGCDKTYTKNSHLIRHLVETHKMAKPAPKVNRRLTPNFGVLPSNGGTGLLQISSSSSSSSSLSSSPSSAVTSTSISTAPSSSLVPTSANRSGDPPMIYNDRPYACTFPGCGWSFKRQYHLNRHIITHRMNNNRKDGNNRNQNGAKNSAANQQNNIINSNPTSTTNNMANLNTNLNNATDLTALINLARNLAAARAKSESISWIVLEEGDEEEEEDNSSDDQQQLNLSTRRHISIEEDTFCCDFPGCGKTFINSRDLMQHYLGHSGPSSGLLLNSHLINSSAQLSQLLDEPPLECVLEEFDDDDDEDIPIGRVDGDRNRGDEEDEEADDNEEEDEDEDEENGESINGHLNGLTINLSKNREFANITATDSD